MRKKRMVSLLVFLAVVVAIVVIVKLGSAPDDYHAKYEGADLTVRVGEIGRDDTYEAYLQSHASESEGNEAIPIDVLAYDGDAKTDQDHPDSVYTADGSFVTWKVQVPEAGMYRLLIDYLTVDSRGVDMERELYINGEIPFSGASQLCFTRLWTDLYNIRLDYLTVASRGIDIERELRINGEVPFSGASTLCFSRQWTDAGEVRKDNQGNDIRPSQQEIFDWQQAYCKDDMGYVIEPYKFFFHEGENTVSLKAVNEPMIIRAMTLMPVVETQTYSEYQATMPAVTMSDSARSYQQIVQGESAALRSSPSLYARYDRSSPDTVPYSVTNTVMNYIGGDPWNTAGQWIEWNFSVPEDGLYTVSLKARQAYQRGALSCRSFYIAGQTPFQEG